MMHYAWHRSWQVKADTRNAPTKQRRRDFDQRRLLNIVARSSVTKKRDNKTVTSKSGYKYSANSMETEACLLRNTVLNARFKDHCP